MPGLRSRFIPTREQSVSGLLFQMLVMSLFLSYFVLRAGGNVVEIVESIWVRPSVVLAVGVCAMLFIPLVLIAGLVERVVELGRR
jgi:hypothetical protein